jgi:hypothetical protein
VLALSLLPAAGHASKARIKAMQVGNQYTVDRLNVQTFPSALFQNQNLVFGELGFWEIGSSSDFNDPEESIDLENADRSLGLYLGNLWEGRAGVFGVELNENAYPLTPTMGGEFINRTSNESFALYWANQFSGATVGLELNRTNSNLEHNSPAPTGQAAPASLFLPAPPGFSLGSDSWETFASAASQFGAGPWNSMGFGAGVSMERQTGGGNTNLFEFGGEIRTYSFKLDADSTVGGVFGEGEKLENDNGISFSLDARGMLQSNQSLTWVPYLGFAITDLGYQFTDVNDPAGTLSADNKMTNFEGGVAANWNLRQNDLLILGAAFRTSTVDWQDGFYGDTLKVTYTQHMTLFAALEGVVFKWLTWRMGASKPITSTFKVEDPATDTDVFFGNNGEDELTDSPFNFAVGTGFHFGNFTLDAELNQDYTFSGGPLAASGTDPTVYPFGRLSATYRY